MAYIEPNTTIKFLQGVPFDPEYRNTMYFANTTEQETYMNSKVAVTVEKNSYQRKSRGVLKVGWVVDTLNGGSIIRLLYNANYMMFRNDNFENKWFYAFVTNVEYVNNNTVEVYYTIDVVQTWLFAFNFNQCLIEREHVTTDSIGSNLIPENLELGEYVMSGFNNHFIQFGICVVTTFDDDGDYCPGSYLYGYSGEGANSGGYYFSGLYYRIFTAAELNDLNDYLEALTSDALINGVVAIFMCDVYYRGQTFDGTDGAAVTTISTKVNGVDTMGESGGYVPRNKKLLTYPYNFIYATNNQGASASYRYEYGGALNKDAITLKRFGTLSCNPGEMLWPTNYKGKENNFEEGLTLTGFPLCAWSYDTFKAWLSQNAGTITAAGIASAVGVGKFIASAASPLISGAQYAKDVLKNPSGYANPTSEALTAFGMGAKSADGISVSDVTGLAGAAALLGQVYDHYIKPPTNEGNSNGNIQYQMGLMHFMTCKKYITPQFASIIDSFFDMYGYATHRVGTPNLNARPCYSYVKTVGASIDGNLPASDCKELEAIFDRGIRFWKTTATFGSFDPTVNNNSPT